MKKLAQLLMTANVMERYLKLAQDREEEKEAARYPLFIEDLKYSQKLARHGGVIRRSISDLVARKVDGKSLYEHWLEQARRKGYYAFDMKGQFVLLFSRKEGLVKQLSGPSVKRMFAPDGEE